MILCPKVLKRKKWHFGNLECLLVRKDSSCEWRDSTVIFYSRTPLCLLVGKVVPVEEPFVLATFQFPGFTIALSLRCIGFLLPAVGIQAKRSIRVHGLLQYRAWGSRAKLMFNCFDCCCSCDQIFLKENNFGGMCILSPTTVCYPTKPFLLILMIQIKWDQLGMLCLLALGSNG